MACVSVDDRTSWVVARWAFRTLVARAATTGESADAQALHIAVALDGLHLDLLEAGQQARLRRALHGAAQSLRTDLAGRADDPRDAEFAGALAELQTLLSESPVA